MKIFKIKADTYGWDEYDSVIVACESKEKLQKLIDDGAFHSDHPEYWFGEPKHLALFSRKQKLSIEEIELDKIEDTEMLLGSYNAG